MDRDPRDIGTPGEKEWAEFRAMIAPFFLLTWLLEELDHVAPKYFHELEDRFYAGFDNAEYLKQDLEGYDGAVPIEVLGFGAAFYEPEEAKRVLSQLFPHSLESEGDFRYLMLGSAVVGGHSALESLARANGIGSRPDLPRAIREWLKRQSGDETLSSELMDDLRVLDATRHLMVHGRGVIDERYLRAVQNSRLEVGELRPLDIREVRQMLGTSWDVAALLYRASPR